MQLLLDTDIGTDVDDATALLLLCGLEADLALVTTVSGRTEVRALLARRLLDQAGHFGVPVCAGGRGALASDRFGVMMPGDGLWLGHEGKGVLTDAEIANLTPSDPAAAIEQMISTIETASTAVTVIAIGPLTNLALALERRPTVRDNIDRLVAMGGVVHGPIRLGTSELPPILEYNFNADREALARVLEAGIDTTLIPAELTYQTRWGAEEVAAIRRSRHRALVGLADMIDSWSEVYPPLIGQFGVAANALAGLACHLHDSMTVLAIFRPELFEFEAVRIDLIEENGQLVTPVSPGGAFAVTVAGRADVPSVDRVVLETILRLGAQA